MAIVNGYCTLAEIKAELAIETADTQFDARLENAITDASRAIDGEADRRFYSATETRYLTPSTTRLLIVPDLVSVTSFAIDEANDGLYSTTWVAADYILGPDSADDDGRPYVLVTPSSTKAFTVRARAVKIVGVFGFPAVPSAIRRACILEAARLFRRPDAVFGITGNIDFTPMRVPAMDPDVRRLVRPYRRKVLA